MSRRKPARHTVGEVARLAHVTVRTLHHYDEIGLLVPRRRGGNDYRVYDDADLERLHQILIFRELGFSLEAIQQLLDAPAFERGAALEAQRSLLAESLKRTRAVIRAVDAALESLKGDEQMDRKKMFEGFEELDPARHEEEVEQRWGATDAYKESMRRTKRYTKQDWARIKADAERIEARLAELLLAGHAPSDPEATAAAEDHRQHMDRWYYPVSHALHVELGRMYVADARFAAHYDRRAEGLASFVAAAIEANAKAAGAL